MTGLPSITQYAIFRRTFADCAPNCKAASEAIWCDWRTAAGSSLPDKQQRQIFAVARVTCVEDIPLHSGLMQILRHYAVQAFPIFVLPSMRTLEIARRIALREGWASLAGFTVERDVSEFIARFSGDEIFAFFPTPSPVPLSSLQKGLTGDAANLAQGAFCGPLALAPSWLGSDAVDISSFIAAWTHMERTSHFSTEPNPILKASPRLMVTDTETWVRPMSVEMPDSAREHWIAVTLKGDDVMSDQIIASQPACLADSSGNITVPLPPRFASEAMQTLQVHRLSADTVAGGSKILMNVPPQNIAPWMVSAYLNRGGAGNAVIKAFAHGLGCRLAYAEDEGQELQDIPVVWGVLRESDRILFQARSQGLHFFYIDHAYFNRGHGNSYRITRNAYEAGRVRKVSDSRLKILNLDVQPWRKSGRSIIVCPPTEHFAAAHNCSDWLETTLNALKLETDRPIVVRTKPGPGESTVPLAQALQDAHALVTHSSNVAIEAACLGTPVFVSPTSAAAPIGRTDIGKIESPFYPKREGWLAHLAYSQYSLDEIRDGSAWNLLMYLEDRDFV